MFLPQLGGVNGTVTRSSGAWIISFLFVNSVPYYIARMGNCGAIGGGVSGNLTCETMSTITIMYSPPSTSVTYTYPPKVAGVSASLSLTITPGPAPTPAPTTAGTNCTALFFAACANTTARDDFITTCGPPVICSTLLYLGACVPEECLVDTSAPTPNAHTHHVHGHGHGQGHWYILVFGVAVACAVACIFWNSVMHRPSRYAKIQHSEFIL